MMFMLFSLLGQLTLFLLTVEASGSKLTILDCGTGRSFDCFNLIKRFQYRNYKKAYDEINDYLVKNVETDDPEQNIKAAEKWLIKFSNRELVDKRVLYQSIEQFTDMSMKDRKDECSRSTHKNLKRNYQLARGVQGTSQLKVNMKPANRVEKVILHYMKKHAEGCQRYYMEKFENNISQMSWIDLYRIRNFLNEVMANHLKDYPLLMDSLKISDPLTFIDQHPFEASKFAGNFRSITGEKDAETANRWLNSYVRENKDIYVRYLNKVKFDKYKEPFIDGLHYWNLYQKYLIKPCQNYVERLKSAFDEDLILIKANKAKSEQESEFYVGMSYFRMCKRLIEDQSPLVDDMKRWVMRYGKVEPYYT